MSGTKDQGLLYYHGLAKQLVGYTDVVQFTVDYYDRQHNSVERSMLNIVSRNCGSVNGMLTG